MARINLSIPDAVKAEMDALGTINWSEVARAAFEQQIHIRKRMELTEMQATIERLKQSKITARQLDAETGRQEGATWAQKIASYRDLKRVGQLELDKERGGFASQVDIALGNSGHDWGQSFWNDGDLMHIPSNDYVEGWHEGAAGIWKQVADKL